MAQRYDSDADNLPYGMQRVGYDADTQVYTYRDRDGSAWEGQPGARYGVLHRAGQDYPSITPEQEHTIKEQNKRAWRYMAPFILLVCAFVLLVFRLVDTKPATFQCGSGQRNYLISPGDSCWDIASQQGTTVERLKEINIGLDCDRLQVDGKICLPENSKGNE